MFARFLHSYAALPERFHAQLSPTPVAAPGLIAFNQPLAAELGVERGELDDDALAAYCAGNRLPPGSLPLAMAYAGHQFGQFVPQLGDGRALLIGEVIDRHGRRRDLQWKGSGPTPFSRRGDGRSALGPVLREYLVSEAMHALGVPTTRSLSAVTTGEEVQREEPLPGGVLVRVAASHVRVGTFEFFAARGDTDALRLLADHVVERHDPALAGQPGRFLSLLQAVAGRQAALVARWMNLGFIHGVMNTDNMTVSGETIDFGPCAFMDEYDPQTVFSYIDRRGRYAYGNQPAILGWNLARLAEALLPLFDSREERAVELAQEVLRGVPGLYDRCWLAGQRCKLGLAMEEAGDRELAESLLRAMHAAAADFTNTYRALETALEDPAALPEALVGWAEDWRARIAREPAGVRERLRAANPAYVPRNHRVEEVIVAAVERGDFAPFHALHAVLSRPFEDQPESAAYRSPPRPGERIRNTFCGT